jgi:hypothetical protein
VSKKELPALRELPQESYQNSIFPIENTPFLGDKLVQNNLSTRMRETYVNEVSPKRNYHLPNFIKMI